MKIILIGEDHSNVVARELVLKIIKKLKREETDTTIQFMVEFEPNDYQNFREDIENHKTTPPLFRPLSEIIANRIDFIPIDIPLLPLLKGLKYIKDDIDIGDEALASVLKSNRETIANQFPNVVVDYDGERFIFLEDALKNEDMTLECIEKKMRKNIISPKEDEFHEKQEFLPREEFYKKKFMQKLRDEYFYKRVEQEISKDRADFLIILVGSNHYASLEQIKELILEENFFSISCPRSTEIEGFMQSIIFDKISSKRVASPNIAPQETFYPSVINQVTQSSREDEPLLRNSETEQNRFSLCCKKCTIM